MAERFQKEYEDAAEARQKQAEQQARSRAVGPGAEKGTGPKLGGSRNARMIAAMREKEREERKAKEAQGAGSAENVRR